MAHHMISHIVLTSCLALDQMFMPDKIKKCLALTSPPPTLLKTSLFTSLTWASGLTLTTPVQNIAVCSLSRSSTWASCFTLAPTAATCGTFWTPLLSSVPLWRLLLSKCPLARCFAIVTFLSLCRIPNPSLPSTGVCSVVQFDFCSPYLW